MPATTPIFGFPYPLGTDPVSQGDNDIRALAEDVETVLSTQAGMWLVKTQTVGATAPNAQVTGAFSADYANYFVTWTGGTMSNDTAMRLQLGATSTAYFGAFIHTPNFSGTAVQSAGDNNNSQFTYVGGGNTSQAQASFYLSGPQLAARTYVWASNVSYGTVFGSYSGRQESTTQFTSFTLSPFAGTMSGGTIRVYGLRN